MELWVIEHWIGGLMPIHTRPLSLELDMENWSFLPYTHYSRVVSRGKEEIPRVNCTPMQLIKLLRRRDAVGSIQQEKAELTLGGQYV